MFKFKFNHNICYPTKQLTEIWLNYVYRLDFVLCHPYIKKSWHSCVFSQMCHFKSFPSTLMRHMAVAGLFPKTLYPLDLDLLLNTMNLALTESGSDYCKECKYCYFKGGELKADYPLRKSGGSLAFIFSFLPICLFYIMIQLLLF